MSAWDEMVGKVAVIRKASQYTTSEPEAISQALADNPGLYQRYLAERRRGVVSAQERMAQAGAEAFGKRLDPPAPSAETSLLMAYAEPLIRQGGPRGEAIERVCKAYPAWYRAHRRAMLTGDA